MILSRLPWVLFISGAGVLTSHKKIKRFWQIHVHVVSTFVNSTYAYYRLYTTLLCSNFLIIVYTRMKIKIRDCAFFCNRSGAFWCDQRVLGKKHALIIFRFPLTRSAHFSMAAICFRDDYLEERVSPECTCIYIYSFPRFSRARFRWLFGFAISCTGDIRERTTLVPWTLEINPLRVVESYGLSNGSRIKPVGFVLSGRVSDFWWYAGTHARSFARSMVYLIKITRTPY